MGTCVLFQMIYWAVFHWILTTVMRNVFPVITYKERKIRIDHVWVGSLIGELRSDMPSG